MRRGVEETMARARTTMLVPMGQEIEWWSHIRCGMGRDMPLVRVERQPLGFLRLFGPVRFDIEAVGTCDEVRQFFERLPEEAKRWGLQEPMPHVYEPEDRGIPI